MKTPAFLVLGATLLGALGAISPAMAQGSNANTAGQGAATTNSAGQQIATAGGSDGVAACASCHGAKGEGNAQAGFPRLAAQSQTYLARQMNAFANGSRNNPVMTPIAKAMSAQQIEAVSGYYSTLDGPWTKPAAGKGADRGKTLAARGDESLQVQACANCHGPGGRGEAPIYPYLAGQHAPYLVSAMAEWKSKARNSDTSGQMQAIAARLSDADVAALAAYYASLPAPKVANLRTATPSGTPERPAPATSSSGGPANAEPKGVGSEQGAPTTGGSQGPGGGGATKNRNPP